MNMNQKGFANIVVVDVILVGVVGYFAFVKKSEPIAQQPTPTPATTQSKTPAPTPKDETGNWKTYTNAQYGFEFKYPSTYSVKIFEESTVPGNLLGVQLIGPEKGQYNGPSSYIGIGVWNNSKQLSLIDWATANSSFSNYGSDTLNSSFKNETLAGHKAISYSWVGMGDGKTVVVANSQTILLLDTMADSKTDQVWQDFDGVLSAFKFTK